MILVRHAFDSILTSFSVLSSNGADIAERDGQQQREQSVEQHGLETKSAWCIKLTKREMTAICSQSVRVESARTIIGGDDGLLTDHRWANEEYLVEITVRSSKTPHTTCIPRNVFTHTIARVQKR